MTEYAVLLDTTSIQKYVFGSNRLKENLGASYIIKDVYAAMVKDNPIITVKPKLKDGTEEFKGYVGGGNALFYFNSTDEAQKFLNQWSLSLLVKAPGVQTAASIGEINKATEKSDLSDLFKKLNINKSRFIPQTIIPRHGITAECQSSGYSMDTWNTVYKGGTIDKERSNYVSSVTKAKIQYSKKAKDKANTLLKVHIKEYCFTNELDELGQSKGSENYIAIVHIDGNGMGERFRSCKNIKETKLLSDSVKNATRESFMLLIEEIISDHKNGKFEGYLHLKKEEDKIVLPIRSIIMGGDDITFVCEGRMGIYFAKIFMENFEKQKDNNGNNLNLTSCAGIAITKTKFPFYRGYELAEQLCDNAKKVRIKKEDPGSWLDFQIEYGGFSGTLEEIRDSNFKAPQGNLIYRPYKIDDTGKYGFETFLSNAKKLLNKNGETNFPKNKIKELREVLTKGVDTTKYFVLQMQARGIEFPKISGKNYHEKLFDGNKTTDEDTLKTPYFDMVEFVEFYPRYELI
ncbi:MAG: hypothetical protein IH949_13335, partial [Bacteroidetes bacterium]|nr:hypothetical protein [Bacteroidota bacterium]